jgi:hypothetical protein
METAKQKGLKLAYTQYAVLVFQELPNKNLLHITNYML